MNEPKIALCMIVRGDENPNDLIRCLNSVAKYVDGIFITVTQEDKGIKAVAEKYGAFVDLQAETFNRIVTQEEIDWFKGSLGWDPIAKAGDKIFQFDKARNHNFLRVPETYDWILWLDTDDIVRGAEHLKEVAKFASERKPEAADSVFFNYIYQAEIVDGQIKNIVIQHLRERLIKANLVRDGVYKWVAPIHETLIEQRPTIKIDDPRCDVVHLSNIERMQTAIQRNIRVLELSIYDTQGHDPRPIYYLGKACFDLRTTENYDKAIKLFNIYLSGTPEFNFTNKSGWAEERAQCWEYMAEVYRTRSEHNNSIKCLMNSLIECEKFPSIYLSLAYSYLLKQDYDRAVFWAKLAAHIPDPQTTLVTNPRDNKARFLEVMYHANLNMSKLDEAWAAAQKLAELFPGQEEIQNRLRLTGGMKNQRELTQMIMTIANYLKQTGESYKLKPLLSSAPADISQNPFMVDLYKQIYPPRVWMENEIAIFCGPGFTTWSPKKLKDPQGSFLGGSEEAVVYLSQELVKKGWKVSVYADPGEDEGEYDGVKYYPYYKFNAQDQFNILVAWRNPKFVDGNYKAKKTYIWCHDICNNMDYTPERITKITKVIFLSHWQREAVKNLPEEKCFYSNNGIPE